MPETIKLIPFGEVLRDRYLISKKYNLIEMVGGIWRLTKKCKDNYTDLSYFYYLTGKLEKPEKIGQVSAVKPQEIQKEPRVAEATSQKQMLINELLQL